MNGQILVFENVLIFGMSVMLFMFSFAIFMTFQDYYETVAIHDQLNKLQSKVVSAVIYVATVDDATTSVTVIIPETIANEYYTIGFDNGRLEVALDAADVKKISNVFNLGKEYGMGERPFDLSGSVVSKRGKITIYKNGDQINIL